MDLSVIRNQMVDEQISSRGVLDKNVLAAFRKVPREKFIPENMHSQAYNDYPLPIGHNQTISQPYIVALMTECLQLSGKESVLEIGTGSGYQAAILAELSKQVFTIERIPELLNSALKTLTELGYSNIQGKCADGTLGWPEKAPTRN